MSTVPPSYGSNLPATTLELLTGVLEEQEGYGAALNLPGRLYMDSVDFTANEVTTTGFTREQLRQQLIEHTVPVCCQGCGSIFPHAKVSMAQSPNDAGR